MSAAEPITTSVPPPPVPDDLAKTLGMGGGHRAARIARYVALGLALLVAVGLGVRYYRSRAAAAVTKYETAEAALGDLQVAVTATGTIQGLTTVEVGAEVSGRVLSILVDFNDQVKKGQRLAEIDPEQVRAAHQQAVAQTLAANAAIAQAEATRTEAKINQDRATLLEAEGLATKAELQASQAALLRAEAGVKSARANAAAAIATEKSARWRLDRTTIISPIDGIVLARLVEPGQTVTAGFTTPVLFKIAADLTQMAVYVDVDEADVGRVREGEDATFLVDAYPQRTFTGKVTQFRNEPKLAQNVVTYQAVISFRNDERLLRPGMTANVTILSDHRSGVLLVPNAALRFTPPNERKAKKGQVESDKEKRVWILRGDKPVAIPVVAGATDGQKSEINALEITPGTVVLVDVVGP